MSRIKYTAVSPTYAFVLILCLLMTSSCTQTASAAAASSLNYINSRAKEPVFDFPTAEPLEYTDNKLIARLGENALLMDGISLKDSKEHRYVMNTDGDVLLDSLCEYCAVGQLGNFPASFCSHKGYSAIYCSGSEYPIVDGDAVISADFSREGELYLIKENNNGIYAEIYEFADETLLLTGSIGLPDYSKGIAGHINLPDEIGQSPTAAGPIPLIGTPTDPIAYSLSDLRDAADKIEDKHGIQILIGDAAALDFPDYSTEAAYDEEEINYALQQLDEALSLYPKGYFEAVCSGVSRGILFCLVGKMTPKNDINIYYPDAFTVSFGDAGIIAIDVTVQKDIAPTVCHEITHITDKKLTADAAVGSNDFCEEEWAALNPTGFDYYNAYLDENGCSYTYTGGLNWTGFDRANPTDSIYFVDSYSKTFPTEDRARLMEVIMWESDLPEYVFNSHIQAKLRYYFAAIRQIQGVDDAAPLYWERALLTPLC